jgi:tripartite-type tricarboxylate transporter receptor subunit TctC
VPTTVELGFPELKISNWYGLFITATTPVDKRRELEGILLPVLQSPHVQAQLAAAGIRGVQPADPFKKSIEQEFLAYDTLVKHLGIAAE